jgi:hypothetical protein
MNYGLMTFHMTRFLAEVIARIVGGISAGSTFELQ